MFGFACYKHVSDVTVSQVTLLIGYHSTCAYKFYFPVTNRIDIMREIIMKES